MREKDSNQNQIFDIVVLSGKILLENGAEIYRVEETMKIIARHYNINELDVFAMANGIFTSMLIEGEGIRTGRSMHIPISPVHLGRVTAVNNISREIINGKYTVEEAIEALKVVEAIPYETNLLRILFAGVGSAAFGYMLGGTLNDSLVSFIAGIILYTFIIRMQKVAIPEILKNAFGSALVTTISILLYSIGLGTDLDHIMIGSIICLVPGVSFTTSVRNYFAGDYLSGTVRLVNALLVSLSISVGVGSVMMIFQMLR
ncbi:MAG: threonine/serine exporter family protein [Lachnotalea sp.]